MKLRETLTYMDEQRKENKRIWKMWRNIIQRCNSCHPMKRYYENISICDEWLNFTTFLDWCNNNGYTDELEIDRTNNEKGYEPSNCRFVTHKENARNRRNAVIVDIGNGPEYFAAICERYNVNYNLAYARMRTGKHSLIDCFTLPIMDRKGRAGFKR